MQYRRLNHTDLFVSPLCLGTGQFGSNISEDIASQQLDEFHDLGGNLIDTAHVYGNWVEELESPSEKIIGRWMKRSGKRNEMIITTKGGHPELEHMDIYRLQEKEIVRDIEESLSYLQTDHIDLFLLHRDDRTIPVERIIDCLDTCVAQGKIRYYGCSNWTLPRIREASIYAKVKGSKGFVANELMWSLADINHQGLPDEGFVPMDRDTYAFHRSKGLNTMAYMSLAKGFFTRKAAGAELPPLISAIYENRTNTLIYERACRSMETEEYSFIDLSLHYLMSIKDMPVIPVAGFRTMNQFREGMKTLNIQIPENLLNELAEIKEYVYWE